MVAFGIPALLASVYLVFVLEILKLKRFRQFQMRRARMLEGEPPPAEAEVDAGVARELETGEFESADFERP
jgi:UDP-GlcNAc:undecaprenyl-phosphate GlcNAc-1-phosphate transferase